MIEPLVSPDRFCCYNCACWVQEHPFSGWGNCKTAPNVGRLFRNHTKRGSYMARHTSVRYYTQPGCKTRFRKRELEVEA